MWQFLSGVQENKELMIPYPRRVLSLMLKKNYDNASSQNEVIAKNISPFHKSSEQFLNERWPLSAAVYV